jgi:hypothetical protein
MLGHELASTTITHGGHLVPSTYGQDQEDEAAWLGATLLLPRPSLLWMRYRGMLEEATTQHFGVSPDLLRWRLPKPAASHEAARRLGVGRFIAARPSKHGHIAPRFVSTSNWVEWQAEYDRRGGIALPSHLGCASLLRTPSKWFSLNNSSTR